MPKKLVSKYDRKPYRKTTTMVVEEWAPEEGGLEIILQTLTASEYEELNAKRYQIKKGNARMVGGNFKAGLCAASIVDEKGKPIFTTADLITETELVLGKIVDKINELNGFEKDEDSEKNATVSEATTADA